MYIPPHLTHRRDDSYPYFQTETSRRRKRCNATISPSRGIGFGGDGKRGEKGEVGKGWGCAVVRRRGGGEILWLFYFIAFSQCSFFAPKTLYNFLE